MALNMPSLTPSCCRWRWHNAAEMHSSWTHLFHQPFLFYVLFILLFFYKNASANESLNNSLSKSNGLLNENSLTTKLAAATTQVTSISNNGISETTPSLGENINQMDAGNDKHFSNSNEVSLEPSKSKLTLKLFANPPNPVANCSDVEFLCTLTLIDNEDLIEVIGEQSPKSPAIWWTFRGSNVSALTLPGGRVTNDKVNLSILNVDCAQFDLHNGDYMCHIADFSNFGPNKMPLLVNSNNATLEIFVPLSLEASLPPNGTVRDVVDAPARLTCLIYAYPKPKITWQRIDLKTLTVSDIEEDGRIVIETKPFFKSQQISSTVRPNRMPTVPLISVPTVEGTLIFKSLMRLDNGTYVCKAHSAYTLEKPLLTTFNVIVLEIPQIHIEKLEIENKTAAIVTFIVDYDGNLPVEKYLLEMMNFTMTNFSWITQNVNENSIANNHNYSTINVENLAPGATYGFRLAAKNEVGSSDWSYMNISVPPDVPSNISNVHLLSKTNETLLFGWRRPMHDNGGIITQYRMILKDSSLDAIISNQTLDITSSGTVQSRNNYMYMFPNLKPGSHYNFQVRACSHIGCSDWSVVLDAVTSDGHADPPLNIRLECTFDLRFLQNNATITWHPPTNPRGSIVGYNISLEGYSHFRNAHNRRVLDQFRQFYEVMKTDTFLFQVPLKPNTNYTTRMCAINKSGCGQMSHITSSSMCTTASTAPSEFPASIKFEPFKPAIVQNNNAIEMAPFAPTRQLKLFVPRISERNGSIKCYRVVMLRLPVLENVIGHQNSSKSSNSNDKLQPYKKYLTKGPDGVTLSTYKIVSESRKDTLGAYIDKEFSSDNFRSEIIIGDGKTERCLEDAPEYDVRNHVKQSPFALSTDDNRSPRRISYDLADELQSDRNNSRENGWKNLVEDGELLSNTNYSGFIEVTILSWNKTLLIARSSFIEPIEIEPLELMVPELSKSSFSETANGILFGTLFGLLLIMVLLFSVLCFIKRKATETHSQASFEDERIGLTSIIRRTIGGKRKPSLFHPLNFNSIGSIKKWAAVPIPVHNLAAVYQERHANSDFLFQAEFESLPENFPDRTTNQSDATENAGKNRYPDIKSYDQTRVVLSKIDGEPGSDYINADFVTGYKDRKHFICAQGPIQKTIGDFWRLIFEQKCFIIVMLTGIEEQGRIKCAQYWNDDQPKEVTNFLNVNVTSRRKYSDYEIRRFSLHNTKNGEFREVLHFHFTAWKDFLAPEQPSWLLRFIKRVNEHHYSDRGPILVHCSAGVGRTGTFIAIDNLISQIDDGASHINIFECVSRLRHQRNFLVQSIKQYIFVYRAIMEYIEFGDTEIEAPHVADHYKQLKEQKLDCGNGIIMEFEKLISLHEMEEQKSCVVGLMEINRAKNRYDFIIPYDYNRVVLMPSGAKDQYYINASYIQGYDHTITFIVAQDPKEDNLNEFWWMAVEHNVSTLVMLAELGEGQSKCPCYWPSEEFDCDYVKVKLIEEEMSQYYTKRIFCVTQKKTNDVHTVTQFQFLAWKSGVVPESTVSLFTLIDAVLANNKPNSPILVHCSGGGDRSSVFAAFASLVKQLRLEERVDVFETARYTRSQRQCMLKTIAQYDFLYRSIIDYIEYHHICNNHDTQL